MIAPAGLAANMRAWAGEIEHLLSPLATGHLHDINVDSSVVITLLGNGLLGN